MIWRIALVLGVIGAAWLFVSLWERRTSHAGRLPASGLTLITGAGCKLCPLAVAAAGAAGIPVAIVDIADAADSSIRAIPTALVTDVDGRVIARRSGRSAISAMPELIALARSVA